MCTVDTPLAGFALLFGVFYIFNISYPVDAGATLEYVQRYVMNELCRAFYVENAATHAGP